MLLLVYSTLGVFIFLGIRREVVQIIYNRKERKTMQMICMKYTYMEKNASLYMRLTSEEHAVLSHTDNNLQELMLQRDVLPSRTLLLKQKREKTKKIVVSRSKSYNNTGPSSKTITRVLSVNKGQ